jgi:hypothetical protein
VRVIPHHLLGRELMDQLARLRGSDATFLKERLLKPARDALAHEFLETDLDVHNTARVSRTQGALHALTDIMELLEPPT